MWRLALCRFADVTNILSELPLRHSEKTEKAKIALSLRFWAEPRNREDVIADWVSLKLSIRKEVAEFIELARAKFGQSST